MDSPAAWVGLIGGILGIVVALGGIAAYLGSAKDKGTISTLESNNRALEGSVALLKEQVSSLTAEAGELKGRVVALERENDQLRAERPSAERIADISTHVAAIESNLASHDTETRDLLQAIITNVQREGL